MGQHARAVVSGVLLCPGQGAQRVGMGRDLAERFVQARDVFESVDDALGFALSQLMWEGPEAELTLTQNAQPAILTHSIAVYAVVRGAFEPVAAAGHSIGEYTAYTAAGTLEVTDAVRLVRRRGKLMHAAGTERRGTMLAIIGLDSESVIDVCRAESRNGHVVVAANLNAPDQTVISGDPAAVEKAGTQLREMGAKRVLPLKVSGAFHSPLMEPAQVGLRQELERVHFADPAFPVIANATAEPVIGASAAQRLLGEQLTAPVRWAASMERVALAAGLETMYVEIGPGNVLSGLVRRIVRGVEGVSLATAEHVTEFLERVA